MVALIEREKKEAKSRVRNGDMTKIVNICNCNFKKIDNCITDNIDTIDRYKLYTSSNE